MVRPSIPADAYIVQTITIIALFFSSAMFGVEYGKGQPRSERDLVSGIEYMVLSVRHSAGDEKLVLLVPNTRGVQQPTLYTIQSKEVTEPGIYVHFVTSDRKHTFLKRPA